MEEKKVIMILGDNQNQREQMACDIRNGSLNSGELHFYFARNFDDARAILESVDVFLVVFLAADGQANNNRFILGSLRALFRGEIICGASEKADRIALLETECDLILQSHEVPKAALDFIEP